MSTDTLLDLDAMLDEDMSAVENLPDYITPPSCDAVLDIKSCELEQFDKRGKDGEKDSKAVRIRLTYAIEEVTEYAEDDPLVVESGSLFSDTFMFDDKGKAIFKRTAAKYMGGKPSDLDQVSFRDIFAELVALEPFEARIVTSERNGYTNTKVTPIRSE